jgi:hypothetical protein
MHINVGKKKMTKKLYSATTEESPDGSGDIFLNFPPDFIEETGWKEGDIIHMYVENNTLILRNKSKEANT